MTNTISLRLRLAILAFASLLALPPTAVDAGTIAVTWENVGSDLKASWTGTFNTSGWTVGSFVNGLGSAISGGDTTNGNFFFNSSVSGTGNLTNYSLLSAGIVEPDNFDFNTGTTGTFTGTSFEIIAVSGQAVGFDIENSWQNNDPVTGTATWAGTNLSAVFGSNLPLFVSKTMYSDGTNTVTFQAVPEPSAALLALGGAATVLWQMSRRKRPVAQAVASR